MLTSRCGQRLPLLARYGLDMPADAMSAVLEAPMPDEAWPIRTWVHASRELGVPLRTLVDHRRRAGVSNVGRPYFTGRAELLAWYRRILALACRP